MQLDLSLQVDQESEFERNAWDIVAIMLRKGSSNKIYLQVLRAMTPEQRLQRAFELSEFTRELFLHGLRKRHPDFSEQEIHSLFLKRLKKCYNRNY